MHPTDAAGVANSRVKRSVLDARWLIGRSSSPEGDKEVRLSTREPTKHWSTYWKI